MWEGTPSQLGTNMGDVSDADFEVYSPWLFSVPALSWDEVALLVYSLPL